MILIVNDAEGGSGLSAYSFQEGDRLSIRPNPPRAGEFRLEMHGRGEVLTSGSFEEVLAAFDHILTEIRDHVTLIKTGENTLVQPNLVIRLDRL